MLGRAVLKLERMLLLPFEMRGEAVKQTPKGMILDKRKLIKRILVVPQRTSAFKASQKYPIQQKKGRDKNVKIDDVILYRFVQVYVESTQKLV